MMASETYEDALNALGTLISKQRRTNGLKLSEAFAAMHLFLHVCAPAPGTLYLAEYDLHIDRQRLLPAMMHENLSAEAETD